MRFNFRRLKPRLTYANVIASLALFLALSGGAYAAHTHQMGTHDIRDNAITASKLANGSVGARTLQVGAVRPHRIARNSIYPAHITLFGVRPRHISNDAIVPRMVRDESITASKLADETIGSEKIADNAINRDKLASGSVGTGNLANGAVGSNKIANGAVGESKLADGIPVAKAYGSIDTAGGIVGNRNHNLTAENVEREAVGVYCIYGIEGASGFVTATPLDRPRVLVVSPNPADDCGGEDPVAAIKTYSASDPSSAADAAFNLLVY